MPGLSDGRLFTGFDSSLPIKLQCSLDLQNLSKSISNLQQITQTTINRYMNNSLRIWGRIEVKLNLIWV